MLTSNIVAVLYLVNKGISTTNMLLRNFLSLKFPAAQQASFIALVDKILSMKAADPDADTTDLENEIDQLVYALYDLTLNEIAIVEGAV